MNKNIMYDKSDRKLSFIVAVVSTVLFAIAVFLLRAGVFGRISFSVLELITVGGFFLIAIMLVSWTVFLDSSAYLNRLKKHGFIVPDNKRKYGNNIERLVEGEIRVCTESSKESLVFAILSWIVALGMVGFSIYYFVRFFPTLGSASLLGLATIALAILEFLIGFLFFGQRKRDRYRDDVEYNSNLKRRFHIMEGIIIIAGFATISVACAECIYIAARYM